MYTSVAVRPKASARQKLVILLVIGDVTMRFFTNYLNVIPRVFNLSDQFILGLLAVLFLFGEREKRPAGEGWERQILYWGLFNLIAVVGTLLNTQYIYPLAAGSGLLLWNTPIVLFLILMRIPIS